MIDPIGLYVSGESTASLRELVCEQAQTINDLNDRILAMQERFSEQEVRNTIRIDNEVCSIHDAMSSKNISLERQLNETFDLLAQAEAESHMWQLSFQRATRQMRDLYTHVAKFNTIKGEK